MDPAFVEAFKFAISNFFSTMLSTEVEIADPSVSSSFESVFDVSGIIGLSGDVQGSVVVSFPTSTAEAVVTKFAGMPMSQDDDDFTDAIGEVTNMIAGGAKSNFPDTSVSISCPSVVVGHGHKVFRRHDLPVIEFACTCDCGAFAVQVTLKKETAAGSGNPVAQAA
ncbi:MAG: chemotaxis protein CheX [Candidatus Eisenbacteria bacterium]|nr:chemotaxis protein CheX [Candidatus Eisenbacteria bacterium]